MKHLSELLERRNQAETTYKEADSSLDGGSLAFILAKEGLRTARMEWFYECEAYVLSNVLFNNEEEIV